MYVYCITSHTSSSQCSPSATTSATVWRELRAVEGVVEAMLVHIHSPLIAAQGCVTLDALMRPEGGNKEVHIHSPLIAA